MKGGVKLLLVPRFRFIHHEKRAGAKQLPKLQATAPHWKSSDSAAVVSQLSHSLMTVLRKARPPYESCWPSPRNVPPNPPPWSLVCLVSCVLWC